MTLVIDASVAAKWYVAEPDSRPALAVGARGGLIAPDLILAEVANILWKAEPELWSRLTSCRLPPGP